MSVSNQPRAFSNPGGGQNPHMMERPVAVGVPPGLEYLTQINQVLIHQQVELLEVFTGFQCKNRYQIKNSLGQQVYFASEESSTCMRMFCGSARGFTIHIIDNLGTEVFRITREFKCCAGCSCCAGCCLHCAFLITVSTPTGEILGYAKQLSSCLETRLSIQNKDHDDVFLLQGPKCICQGLCCQADVEFKVLTTNNLTQIGSLNKQWAGFAVEAYTNASNFSASFPMDLDVKMKAVLIGTVFLLDFMHFEQKNQNN